MSARATFNAVCHDCQELRPRCATCAVTGTNVYGDPEVRDVVLCGPCRRACRGRCRLHPKHRPNAKEGPK